MFQTQQSLQSNGSFSGDTQHYSTFQQNEQDRTAIPFDEVLIEHMKTISRNHNIFDDLKSFRNYTKDEGVQVSCNDERNANE